MNKIFIVIPCYNEAEQLAKVVESVKPYGQIIVVDDGSSDDSYEIAKQAGATVLRHLINRGMGAALETGDRFALRQGADIVVHFDADGQHRSEEIPKLIEPILNGQAEAALGSRFLSGQDKTPWLKKYFILKPAVSFQNLMLGVKLTDTHNGFRTLSGKMLAKIGITQDGMAHATEIIEQIKNSGLVYQEVGVTVVYHEFGQGFLSGLRIIRDLLFGKISK